jgi:hypothetical protein
VKRPRLRRYSVTVFDTDGKHRTRWFWTVKAADTFVYQYLERIGPE